MRKQSTYHLTTVVLCIAIGVLLLVSAVFVVASYTATQKTIEREVERSFNYRNQIAELSITELLEGSSDAITAIVEHIIFDASLTPDDLSELEHKLSAFNLSAEGGLVDIMALVSTEKAVLTNLNSPLSTHTDPALNSYLTQHPFEDQWQLVISDSEIRSVALMNSTPIVEVEYGQVVAYILYGITVTENTPLANLIRLDAEVDGVELIVNSQPLTSSFTDEFVRDTEHYLSQTRKTPYTKAGKPLAVRSHMRNSLKQELDNAYKKNLMILLMVSLVAAIAALVLIRHITTTGFNRLMKYAEDISQGLDTKPYKSGNITEFNRLAHALEDMMISVRASEAALRNSEQQQRDLLNNTSSVIYIKALDGKYLFINQKYATLFHTSDKQMKGRTDYDLFPEEIADAFRANDRRVELADRVIEMEEIAHHEDGYHTYISVKFPLKNAKGETYAICGVSTDITERKQAEEQMRQLRNYLASIINSMPSILIGVDSLGLVTQWNSKAAELTGIPTGTALGKSLTQVFPRLSLEMPRIQQAIENNERLVYPKQALQLNGETYYEDVTIYPLNDNGIESAVIRLDDVTEQARMEEMIVQSEKMLSVGGLAAGMAHEINNPLAGMMQTANVMRSRLTNTTTQANIRAAEEAGITMGQLCAYMEARGIWRMCDAINESGSRVADIIDNMLSFSRKNETSRTPHNVATLLDKTLELAATDYDLKKDYDFKNIDIIRDYTQRVSTVPCESGKIQQVLFNILRNGAEAMHHAQTKTPSLWLRIYQDNKQGMVYIEIKDNGPGIDEATRKRVFEPFFTTKPVGVGTGLGLSVSYFIITENHRGKLSVTSELGVGTKFTIGLPMDGGREA